MDQVHAVGRLQLLQWINHSLEMDYTKVEHLCDGIAYAQIFDAIFPDKVPLHSFNFNARFPEDCSKNLSLLQRVFRENNVPKTIPVEELSRGRFQDNNEFARWVYGYTQRHHPSALDEYNAYERRMEAKRGTRVRHMSRGMHVTPGREEVIDDFSSAEAEQTTNSVQNMKPSDGVANEDELKGRKAELDGLIVCLQDEVTEELQTEESLGREIEDVVCERDFFFEKLRGIEALCELSGELEVLDIIRLSHPALAPTKH